MFDICSTTPIYTPANISETLWIAGNYNYERQKQSDSYLPCLSMMVASTRCEHAARFPGQCRKSFFQREPTRIDRGSFQTPQDELHPLKVRSIQPGPTGLHRCAARRLRSCPNRLQTFGGVPPNRHLLAMRMIP
jgi:hypothetical protein